jgi:hypothetical protein
VRRPRYERAFKVTEHRRGEPRDEAKHHDGRGRRGK